VRVVGHEPPAPEPVPLPGGDFAFVFEANGTTYVKLADLDADDLPAHGKIRLAKDDYIDVAIARVKPGDLPGHLDEWLGRSVVVDGACTAKVTGFAIVSRANGGAGWADTSAHEWTGELLIKAGSHELAAALDRCTGTYARDAALPPIVVPESISAPALEAKAKQLVIDSPAAKETDDGWHHQNPEMHWWQSDEVLFSTQALRHPKTGETWVSVFAHRDHECGDAQVNVWGLFRVERDGSLTAVQLRTVDETETIDELIDVDGDGTFELLGTPWLGPARSLYTIDGKPLRAMSVQFLGCPC